MRVVIQRVSGASVQIDGGMHAEIGRGLAVLAAFAGEDTEDDLQWMAKKIAGLRVFEDENDRMNLAAGDIAAELLIVPNFTLYADCNKGRRPGFSNAAPPDVAESLFDEFCELIGQIQPVQEGVFGADMEIELTNDGPVTFLIDTEKTF